MVHIFPFHFISQDYSQIVYKDILQMLNTSKSLGELAEMHIPGPTYYDSEDER